MGYGLVCAEQRTRSFSVADVALILDHFGGDSARFLAHVEHDDEALNVGRPLDEALMLARRATFDPGSFTKHVLYREGELETLERWQARAVLVALAAHEPDQRWESINRRGPQITEYERAELARLFDTTEAAAS